MQDKPKSTSKRDAIAERLRAGQKYVQICSDLGVSPSTVAICSKAIKAEKEIPIPKEPGRPTKMTSATVAQVRELTLDNPLLGSDKLAKIVTERLGLPISGTTVTVIRNLLHFKYTSPRSRPMLTAPQIEKRIAFCHKSLTGDIDWEKNVIISDESRFGLYDDSRRIWIQRGVYNEASFRPKPKHNTSLMVWAAICHGWKSKLVFITGNLNAEGYQKMLHDNAIFEDAKAALPERDLRFQQDGAPAHRAKSSVAAIQKELPVIPDWPPNSPDLSVIENVWGILKRRLAERAPHNLQELRRILEEEWQNIPQKTIDDLIESTPERFKLCVGNAGNSIGHLLNKTQRTRQHNGTFELPAGCVTIRNIPWTHIGETITVPGICSLHYQAQTIFQEHPKFTRNHEMPRSILVQGGSQEFNELELGACVVIQGTIQATREKPSARLCSDASALGTRECVLRPFLKFARIVSELQMVFDQ